MASYPPSPPPPYPAGVAGHEVHFHYETNLSELTFIFPEIISDDLRENKS